MIRFLLIVGAAIAASISPAGAVEPASDAAAEAAVLECGLAAFGPADDRIFGESYAAAISGQTGPPERGRIDARLTEQMALCRERHALGEQDFEMVQVHAMGQVLLRGMVWHLRRGGVDVAKLDAIASGLTMAEASDRANPAYRSRAKALLVEAGIPERLHDSATDYMAFKRGTDQIRATWMAGRSAILSLP